jgi:four helix bundle protein
MNLSSFRNWEVWKNGIDLARRAYRLTQSFPKTEDYVLSRQIQRATVSVPANIAEGHARGTTNEYLHHLSIARGSLAELETLLVLAEELTYSEHQLLGSFSIRVCGKHGC